MMLGHDEGLLERVLTDELDLTEETLGLGLIRLADRVVMYLDRMDRIPRTAKGNRPKEWQEAALMEVTLRQAIGTILSPMLPKPIEGPLENSAYVAAVVHAAAKEREHARETAEPVWYRQ